MIMLVYANENGLSFFMTLNLNQREDLWRFSLGLLTGRRPDLKRGFMGTSFLRSCYFESDKGRFKKASFLFLKMFYFREREQGGKRETWICCFTYLFVG